MNNYKFKIRDREEFTRVIDVLDAFYPDIKHERGLRYDICNTKYLYVTDGVVSAGFNTHAFMDSPNTLVELNSLFTMPANLNTEEVYPKLEQKDFAVTGTVSPPTQLNDLMIDIETIGTKPGYVILSIGAVFFDLATGKSGDAFHEIINLESSVDKGFKIDPKTLLWWAKQDKGAYLEALGLDKADPITSTVQNAIYNFKSWIERYSNEKKNLQVWGNSARFDLGMLQVYFDSVGSDLPWFHYNERDVRTLVMFAPHIKDKFVTDKNGDSLTKHKPIDDCVNQIGYCSEIFSKIKVHE